MKLRDIFIVAVILLLSVGSLTAQSRQTRQEYVARYSHIAIAHMEKYGIPASITMAQGILESDSGNSELSTKSNNHFGIKCKSNWTGRTVRYDDDEKNECFRAYKKVEESYSDHADFLDSSPRYDSLFAYSSSDYKSWARGLKAAGYATAPHYATLLIKIIEDEKLYLFDKDNGGELYAMRHTLEEQEAEAETKEKQEEVAPEEIDPDNYGVTINAHKGYNIYRTNGLYFTQAKSGDTLGSIAATFEIGEGNLRRFNDLEKGASLQKGDVIFIERKKAKWEGDDKRSHQASSSESLYTISQRYGIRLKRLARLNSMKVGEGVSQGQIIKIN